MRIAWTLSILLLMLSGCAQPPPKTTHIAALDTRIGTGVSSSVDYVADEKRTAVFLTVDNRKGKSIQVWMVIKHETEDADTTSRTRVYVGSDSSVNKTFRLTKAEEGVKETIRFEVFDNAGKSVMVTEPIIHSNSRKER